VSLGFLRARPRDPHLVFRLHACVGRDAFDRLLPPKPNNGEHSRLVCSRRLLRGLRLVLAREGWDPSIASELALGEEHRGAWGRSTRQGRGTVRFTTHSALRRTGLACAGRYQHPCARLDRASDISVASLARASCDMRDTPARAAKAASAAAHREVRCGLRDPRCLPSVRTASNSVWRRTPFGGGAFRCRADVNLCRSRGAHVMRIAPLRLLRRSSRASRPPRFHAGFVWRARSPFTRIRRTRERFRPSPVPMCASLDQAPAYRLLQHERRVSTIA
jgi:hypothetical protein